MSYKVNEKHTLEEYNQKYGNKDLKQYSKAEVEKEPSILNDKEWWLIEGTYYQVEKECCPIIVWWNGLQKAVKIGIIAAAGVVAVGGITAGIIAGANKGGNNDSGETDPKKDDNVPTVALEYWEPDQGAFQYHFNNKIQSVKVTEKEWTFDVSITAADEYTSDWYVMIHVNYETLIAEGSKHTGTSEVGNYTSEKVVLCKDIDLNNYVGQTITVGLGSYTV